MMILSYYCCILLWMVCLIRWTVGTTSAAVSTTSGKAAATNTTASVAQSTAIRLGNVDEHFQPLFTTLQPRPSVYNKKNEYEYILPQRKVTSCPSFASFKFACHPNHLISIDSLVFSPVLLDSSGECVSDWKSECKDEQDAFAYAVKECSSQEECSLISYQLRSRTKCTHHQVISIYYKCIPTWEITDVPIKCDICKNVTVNNIKDNYGFIHSAWYPKLYPRVTCHSLIQNKPDHYIVIYSVSGSIGLDRIQIESVDNKGALAFREILTGNLTTQLVITSAYDVNVTVLTEDTYYFDQRRFLLYFYIVPKCFVILCSNSTGHPYSPTGGSYGVLSVAPPGYYPPVVGYSTSSAANVYASTSSDAYATVYKPPEYTYAPPLVADNHYKHHSKISDAWLAAILALIYSLLMVFAVLVAIYCRRRRRRRLIQENNIIFGPSTISSSQIINPSTISRTQSQISIAREHSLPISSSNYLTMSKHHQCIDQNTIYSQVNRENYLIHQQQQQQHCQYQLHRDEDDLEDDDQRVIASTFERVTHIPACAPPVPVPLSLPPQIRQYSLTTEFDNYSQVITDEATSVEPSVSFRATTGTSLPFTLKTNTQHGSIMAAAADLHHQQHYASDMFKNMYRAVEYSKGPQTETVRVRNANDLLDEQIEIDINDTSSSSSGAREYDSRGLPLVANETSVSSYHKHQHQHQSSLYEDDNEKSSFVVKLYPYDEQEKEVQEMTMFVESTTTTTQQQQQQQQQLENSSCHQSAKFRNF